MGLFSLIVDNIVRFITALFWYFRLRRLVGHPMLLWLRRHRGKAWIHVVVDQSFDRWDDIKESLCAAPELVVPETSVPFLSAAWNNLSLSRFERVINGPIGQRCVIKMNRFRASEKPESMMIETFNTVMFPWEYRGAHPEIDRILCQENIALENELNACVHLEIDSASATTIIKAEGHEVRLKDCQLGAVISAIKFLSTFGRGAGKPQNASARSDIDDDLEIQCQTSKAISREGAASLQGSPAPVVEGGYLNSNYSNV